MGSAVVREGQEQSMRVPVCLLCKTVRNEVAEETYLAFSFIYMYQDCTVSWDTLVKNGLTQCIPVKQRISWEYLTSSACPWQCLRGASTVRIHIFINTC